MENFFCHPSKANFVGIQPRGNFYVPPEKIKYFFYLCIKNKFSILEKPDKEKQKLILDLDSKEKEIEKETLEKIIFEVKKELNFPVTPVICKRKESFGIHLHFLGCYVNDFTYKELTKNLKKKFPIVDTTPFNHFIPGTGKPGKMPYLPVEDFDFKKFASLEIFCFTKNFYGFETKEWEYFSKNILNLQKSVRRYKKIFFPEELDHIISYLESLDKIIFSDYDSWIKIGFVLAFHGRHDLWHRFSQLCPEKYDEAEAEKKWENLISKTKYGNLQSIYSMLEKENIFVPMMHRKNYLKNRFK